jgi:hypothetical protein
MPNLYFCQPHAKNQGMLRAVLSVGECESMASQHPVTYLGEQFPALSEMQGQANDFAILSFRTEESTPTWRSGYYRLESDLTAVNDALHRIAR